ncbi:MAG: tryptophan--tRNA ligase [Actinomycetota bacterium]
MSEVAIPAKPRVLSGIQASGRLHIGNYVGALSRWAEEQDRYENYFFVADLHALTIPESVRPEDLRARVREIVGIYLACGLDPAKSVLFRQSHVPAHAVLGWILTCMTPVGWLERMTQYKSKSEGRSAGAGLFTYPALQAADILLYQANFVPVGDDQRQHVELTRDVAMRFNHMFGELFVLPEPLIRTTGARIMGLDDPTVKMSKSLAEQRGGHAIALLDPPEKIRNAVMRAVTDSLPGVDSDRLSPGVENLLTLWQVLSGDSREAALARFDGKGYGVLKKDVAGIALEKVGAIQQRYAEIQGDEGYIDEVLADGAKRAAVVAEATLDGAMRRVGLR